MADLFDIAIARKLSGGGGGGGSSDFSTATVTVVNADADEIFTSVPLICDNQSEPLPASFVCGNASLMRPTSPIITIVLYKGVALLTVDDPEVISDVTGSAELLRNVLIVTGDCTITIS